MISPKPGHLTGSQDGWTVCLLGAMLYRGASGTAAIEPAVGRHEGGKP